MLVQLYYQTSVFALYFHLCICLCGVFAFMCVIYLVFSFADLHLPCNCIFVNLSSPRAESARAFTGRRCPHSGKGEDFLTGQLNFFTETAVTPERKVEKSFPMWEINRHAEG